MRRALVRPAPVGELRLRAGRLRLSGGRLRPSPAAGERGLSGRLAEVVAALAVLVALMPLVLYAWAAAHRIAYPYELDWLEGGAVELVARVLDGRSLYTPPTLAYVSYTYPPLYTWVAAAVAEVTGVGFLPLRIVSVASSLVAFAALWKLVLAATADRAAAAVAVGLFAATYGLTGWWFDVGRLDSLFVALTLVALWIGRDASSVRAGVAVGVLAFLAFFTKQVALLAVGPALAYAALTRRRAGVSALITLAALVAGSTLVLDAATGNWYRYYVVSELAGQAWEHREWKGFWRIDLYAHLRPLAWLLLLAFAAAVSYGLAGAVRSRGSVRSLGSVASRSAVLRARRLRAPAHGYELAAAVGLLAAAWISRLHTGGYLNVLLPAYAAAALLGGVAFASLRRRGLVATVIAAALAAVQITGLIGSFSGAIPAPGESAAGAAVIARLRTLPGPVLVLSHPWYGTLAGQGSFAQQDAVEEVLRSSAVRGAADLRGNLADALDRYRIRAVVLDSAPPAWLAPQLAREFVLQSAPLTAAPLRPPGDLRSSPTLLYLRRGSA